MRMEKQRKTNKQTKQEDETVIHFKEATINYMLTFFFRIETVFYCMATFGLYK